MTKKQNCLFDIEDLNNRTYDNKTYNQLCIRTKNLYGSILYPDCIVCMDEIDEYSLERSEQLNTNILVLKRNSNTIEYNDDIYAHLK